MPDPVLFPPAFDDPRDSAALRRALGQFATGITVVTAIGRDGQPVGLTVNSFNSLSLAPPLVVWSLSDHLAVRSDLEACSHYAINVLAADQEALSRRFASRREDPFAGQDWQPGAAGTPLLAGCCAWLEVANTARHPGGDHILFIGEVVRCARSEREPLVYFGSRYRTLATVAVDDSQA